MDRLTSRLRTAGEAISDPEDGSIEITQTEGQKQDGCGRGWDSIKQPRAGARVPGEKRAARGPAGGAGGRARAWEQPRFPACHRLPFCLQDPASLVGGGKEAD